MGFVRRLENRFYGSVRDARADEVEASEAGAWNTQGLQSHKYCLLTSYRASGKAVSTPVWFGISSQRIYIRSGAQDGKIKRIRRDPSILVAPCGARGKPLGPAMEGRARILEPDEHVIAEAVLRSSYGLGRKLYRLIGRRTDVAYLEVSAREAASPGTG